MKLYQLLCQEYSINEVGYRVTSDLLEENIQITLKDDYVISKVIEAQQKEKVKYLYVSTPIAWGIYLVDNSFEIYPVFDPFPSEWGFSKGCLYKINSLPKDELYSCATFKQAEELKLVFERVQNV